jgi:malonyl CoA-acyl carrier protein transacylase
MGGDLFDEVAEFRDFEPDIDSLLGYSLRDLCIENPDGKLKQTQYTQPALYVVNALYYYKARLEGRGADVVVGHSLGEYNALLAAGVFDFMTGLRLVQRRGQLMAEAKNGGMAAVIGLDPTRIISVLALEGFAAIDVANFNSPSQTVISGPTDEIKRAGPVLEAAGAKMYMALPVSAAFHSRYMLDAAIAFEAFLADFSFNDPQIPVIANVTGRRYPIGNPEAVVKSLLTKQISQSVRWTQTIRHLRSEGVVDFEELGPGKVLEGLLRQNVELAPA